MAEIPALYVQRPIVLRHKKAALYHPFMEAVALTLVDVPITFVISVVFSVILYFMVGLQQSTVSNSPSQLPSFNDTHFTESILVCHDYANHSTFILITFSVYSYSLFSPLLWL
jgi:ABC-type multidrug transport system permease subunit